MTVEVLEAGFACKYCGKPARGYGVRISSEKGEPLCLCLSCYYAHYFKRPIP